MAVEVAGLSTAPVRAALLTTYQQVKRVAQAGGLRLVPMSFSRGRRVNDRSRDSVFLRGDEYAVNTAEQSRVRKQKLCSLFTQLRRDARGGRVPSTYRQFRTAFRTSWAAREPPEHGAATALTPSECVR